MISRYEIDKTKKILENDKDLQKEFLKNNFFVYEDDEDEYEDFFRDLTLLLLDNKDEINNKTIDELNNSIPPVVRNEITSLLGTSYITGSLYRQILYTFKYSTVKIFFYQNYSKFMPDYDFTVINSKPKMKLFIDAFMREYDRFASIIDEMYNLVDVDKTPESYLNYLAQMIGYEREDINLLNNVSFRELIKNIIEIYKIKGTNYSFELFFNFLGFTVTLKEYWFDKRFGDDGVTNNAETGSSNKNNYLFYLTTEKPTENIIYSMSRPYTVSEEDIVDTMDLNLFNNLISSGQYNAKQLLGDETGYPDQTYTFFKTNVMEYDLTSIKDLDLTNVEEEEEEEEEESEEEERGELSEADLAAIEKYANFLTPIFMQKSIVATIKPYEESGNIILMTDSSREDPRSSQSLTEVMLHQYQGYQPATYYWDDGVKYYNEDVLRRDKSGIRDDISNPEGGGYFLSGFYLDTFNKVRDIKTSIEAEFPNYMEAQILEELASRISDKSIYDNDFPNRDLLSPYIELAINYFFSPFANEIKDNLPIMYLQNFSFIKGDQKRLSEALNEEVDEKVQIESITLDNGVGNSVVKMTNNVIEMPNSGVNITALNSAFIHLKPGDEIKIFYCRNFKNNGIYTIESISRSGEYINIELEGQVNSRQKLPGGFIQVYYEDWKMKDYIFPTFFDRVIEIS